MATDQFNGLMTSFEILDHLDELCRKNDIKYTLFGHSLLATRFAGEPMPNWHGYFSIALLDDNYDKLIGILQDESDYNPYYFISSHEDASFDEAYCRLYKRGRVVLPEDRRRDLRFYDAYVSIIPLYSVCDSKREYKKIRSKIVEYKKIIDSRALIPGIVRWKPTQIAYVIRNKRNLKRRVDSIMDEFYDYIQNIRKPGSKLITVPSEFDFSDFSMLRTTYEEYEDIELWGHKYMKIKASEEWIDSVYDTKKIEELIESDINIVIKKGTEDLRRVQLIALDILVEFDRICRENDIKYFLAAGTLLGAIRHKGFVPWDDDVDVFMLYEEWEKFNAIYDKTINKDLYFVKTQETDEDDNLVFFQIKRNDTVFCRQGRKAFKTHPGVFIDILPYYNGANTWIGHKTQEFICKRLKTVTWAHLGARSERKKLKRKWYIFLQEHVSNKDSSRLFFKFATMYSKSKYLCYLYVKRNPYKKGINQRRYFEELTEMEFEGHMFYVPKDYIEFIEYTYSKDYMMFPSSKNQINTHFPAHIELGDLHADCI